MVEFLTQVMMFLTILSVTLASYLTSIGALPGSLKFLPEMLSSVVLLYVVVEGTRQRFHLVSTKYWLTFGTLTAVLACGAIANDVGPGPIISGMRYYLRAIPFFFLPAVYDFKDWQLRQYLRLLIAICVLQVPLALYERHMIMATGHTSNADAVYGSLMQTGVLSIFLVCALCILGASMLRGRLPRWVFGALFLLFIVPMSINETKVTAVVLPLGMLITFVLGAPPHKRTQASIAAVIVLAIGGAIFVPIFDYYQAQSVVPYKISDFFTKKDELTDYLDNNAQLGSDKEAGRVDAVTVPLQQLARDPVTLAFGFGIGNASKSSLGPAFTGAHYAVFRRYVIATSIAAFLLEIGTIGVALVLLLHWLVLGDALYVNRRDHGLVGAIALGSVGALAVVTAGLFYMTIHIQESLSYMFWLVAGILAARAERIRTS